MLLTIDVGNTNTVLGVFDDAEASETIHHSWRITTDTRATADEMALLYRGLLDGITVTGIAACSTVPTVLRELRVMLARYYLGVPTVIVEPGVRTGVPLLFDNPREIGSDRIVNTLAAHHLFGGPVVIVDFGTSTNLDVVSAAGEFLGGALAPGIEISVDALARRAAQLRTVELVRPPTAIAKNTVHALQSGTIFGFAGQVDGLVRRILAELREAGELAEFGEAGEPATVVATGGLAPLVIAESDTITRHEPDLTLIGLRLVFDRNR